MSNRAAKIETEVLESCPTALVEKRTLNQVTYSLGGGKHCFNASQSPIHYLENGYYRQIDTAISPSAARVGADVGMVRAGFEAHFNLDLTAPWTAEYRIGASAIRVKPIRLQSGAKQWPVQPVRGVLKDSMIRWENAFGPGIHLEWQVQAGRLAKRVIIDKPLSLTADLDLVLEAQMDNLAMPTIEDKKLLPLGGIGFLRWPASWDETGETVKGKLLLPATTQAQKYITHRVPRSWLKAAQYPIVIDVQFDQTVGANEDDVRTMQRIASPYDWLFSNTDTTGKIGCYYSGYQKNSIAMRFLDIDIPRDAFTYDSTCWMTPAANLSGNTCKVYMWVEDVDDATQITDDPDMRGRVATSAKYDVLVMGSWVLGTEMGYYISPGSDRTSSLNEVLARPGWERGNAINVFFEDFDDRSTHATGCYRSAASFDNTTYDPPRIRVYWMNSAKPQGMMF